jgi:predicted O-methyltransferase YrrM
MIDPLWAEVDSYLAAKLVPEDDLLAAARRANSEANLPAIDVTPLQGRLLYLLAKLAGARSILEIGTLGGYSTICLARALPADGLLISLELEPKHAEVARANLRRAGLAAQAEIRVGPARESLAALQAERRRTFDVIFIDADKAGTADYFRASLELAQPGALIIVDNVVRRGRLIDANSQDSDVTGMRRFLDLVAAEPRVEATGIQTVCGKGYDGFVIARVRG